MANQRNQGNVLRACKAVLGQEEGFLADDVVVGRKDRANPQILEREASCCIAEEKPQHRKKAGTCESSEICAPNSAAAFDRGARDRFRFPHQWLFSGRHSGKPQSNIAHTPDGGGEAERGVFAEPSVAGLRLPTSLPKVFTQIAYKGMCV